MFVLGMVKKRVELKFDQKNFPKKGKNKNFVQHLFYHLFIFPLTGVGGGGGGQPLRGKFPFFCLNIFWGLLRKACKNSKS